MPRYGKIGPYPPHSSAATPKVPNLYPLMLSSKFWSIWSVWGCHLPFNRSPVVIAKPRSEYKSVEVSKNQNQCSTDPSPNQPPFPTGLIFTPPTCSKRLLK